VPQSSRVSCVSRGSSVFHIYPMASMFPLTEIGPLIYTQSHPYFRVLISTSLLHPGYFDFHAAFSIIFFIDLHCDSAISSFMDIEKTDFHPQPAIFHLIPTSLVFKLFSCFLPCSPLPLGKTPNKLPQIILPPIILLQIPLKALAKIRLQAHS